MTVQSEFSTFYVVPHSHIGSQNEEIYGPNSAFRREKQSERFTQYCVWAEGEGLRKPEYLLDQICAPTAIRPYSWERPLDNPQRFEAEIAALQPWLYRVEFGDGVDTNNDLWNPDKYDYHRYRVSLFPHLAAQLLGPRTQDSSVIDVACNCGILALEFAAAGFGAVKGIELRAEQIAQAQFLARVFEIGAQVDFTTANARDLSRCGTFDVAFCAGLLYHVTFPMELLQDLFHSCREFLILDTLAHCEPMSAFHLVCNKDVDYGAEGEFHYEYQPTYRAVIDALHAVGFETVLEIIGADAPKVFGYKDGSVRSFLAFRPGSQSERELKQRFNL